MEKEKRILTDVDNVLLEWNAGFDKFMLEHGFHRVPGTDGEYNLAVRFGEDPELILPMIDKWNASDAMNCLEPLADSVKYVKVLADAGFRFTAITSISDKPEAKIMRTNNLRTVFGDVFDDVICLPTGGSKQYELEKWAGTGLFWIEDHFKNAEAGHEVGLKTVLVNTAYNEHFQTDLFPRVSEFAPWQSITKMVFDHYSIPETDLTQQ